MVLEGVNLKLWGYIIKHFTVLTVLDTLSHLQSFSHFPSAQIGWQGLEPTTRDSES